MEQTSHSQLQQTVILYYKDHCATPYLVFTHQL